MSLDDTPVKIPPNSLRRRLATKSMHDLAGAAGFGFSPSRTAVPRDLSLHMARSPRLPQTQVAPSPARSSSVSRSVSSVALASAPASPSIRAPCQSLAPCRSSTAPPAMPRPPPVYDNEDDMPSPFLKKTDATRFPSATTTATVCASGAQGLKPAAPSSTPSGSSAATKSTRPSIGSKPTMASRLLAARAQASAGVDEVGRRMSIAAIPRRKSFAS